MNKDFFKDIEKKQRPTKVLQFGGGNFLRAFAVWLIDQLNKTENFYGNIAIIKPTPKGDYYDLKIQRGIFHTIIQGIQDNETYQSIELIDSINEIINPYQNWDDFLKTAESLETNIIISNTTEAGIKFSEEDFDLTKPSNEFPGKLTQWLHHRHNFFKGNPNAGTYILPCELIEANGESLKQSILNYAKHWNLSNDFRDWIKNHNFFYNTLVDRIVPGFPKTNLEQIQNKIGTEDNLLVTAEPYLQWLIQGNKKIESIFPIQKVNKNAKVIEDLNLYREIKVKILNGAHTAMVAVGMCQGIEIVRDFIKDETLETFIVELMKEEVFPGINCNTSMKEDFLKATIDRFKNPYIDHALRDISLNSLSKIKTRILPSVLEWYDKNDRIPERLALVFACYIHFYRGFYNDQTYQLKGQQTHIDFIQEQWSQFDKNIIESVTLIENILSNQNIWGLNITEFSGFSKQVNHYFEKLFKELPKEIIKEVKFCNV